MATSMNEREKFAEKLLKEWEHIDDDMLVKEVATKGKYINLLLQFLVKRSGKSLIEVKQYFNDEVDNYVHRLLSNRQVHKAELVLKNVGRRPQALFYEFVQSTSQEHIDDDVKDHVLEHLQSCDGNFDVIRDEYDYYLLVLKLVAANKVLRRQFEDEIHVFTLESFLRKSDEFRKLMACTTCLHCKNAILVEKLDKHITWTYLWESEQWEYIAKWLNLLYANKCPDVHENDGNPKEPCFDVALKNLFSTWDIEPEMFEAIQKRNIELHEFILNGFAQNGMITHNERDSIVTILQRIFTTGSFAVNSSWLISEQNLVKIIRLIIEQDQMVLLLNKNLFTTKQIEQVPREYRNDELELCAMFNDEDFSTKQSMAHVSKHCSEYIIKTSDVFFYSKFAHIYLMEQMLMDFTPMELAQSDMHLELLSKISVIDLFLRKLRSTPTITDYETTLDEMLQLKCIDLNVIREEALASSLDNVAANDELITFSNARLNQKYGQSTVLTYIDYVKQYRSAYGVYRFFVDQLNTYSQISLAQIQIACGAVCEIAINNLDDPELIAHCVAFIEMLGINSQTLRAYIQCCHTIKMETGDNFILNACFNDDDVIKQTEEIFLKHIQNNETNQCLFDIHKFQALKLLCSARNSDLPLSFLKEVASQTNWFEFLLFAAYHNYSIRSIVDVCQMDSFDNRNVGLNIGRALKEIIIDDEMPRRRTGSFSYREHRRKAHFKNDATNLLNANHKLMSTSMNYLEKLPPIKLQTCQQFLNINDDMDIFAVILICTSEMRLSNDITSPALPPPLLNLSILNELIKNSDVDQLCTEFNLIRCAFKMQWPILAVLAASLNPSIVDYCWLVWLMISIELPTLPSDMESYAEIAQFTITYTVQANYVRTLHQSFEIFFAESKFIAFTKFLSESSRYQFNAELSALLMDFLYEVDERTVTINDSVPLSVDEMSQFVVTLLIELIKRGFDSMEHQQQLYDTIAASGIANHVDWIDFATIAAIHQIIRFTNVRMNIDSMICHRLSNPIYSNASNIEADTENDTTNALQIEYNRICDELIGEKAFSCALELADLLNLSKDTIVYEQWIHQFENDATHFDWDSCDRAVSLHSISPLVLVNFLIFVSAKIEQTDITKYFVLKKILNAIKRHHLYPNEAIPRDRIEYEMYKCLLKLEQPIDTIEMYNSEYYETIMMRERGVLYKSYLDLKEVAGMDRLSVVAATAAKDQLKTNEFDRLSSLIDRLLNDGDIIQALRLYGIFNYLTNDLHYLIFCMTLAEGLASLFDLSMEQKQLLSDGMKQAPPKFNRRPVRLKRVNTSGSTSASSSPISKTYFDSVDVNRVDFEEFPPNEKQDVLDAIQNLATKVSCGYKLGQRIAMVFRAAMHLEKEYLDVLQTKDPYILLQNTIDDPCVNRLLVMNDIMSSMEMTATEIANFVAEQVARAIIKSRFYLLHTSVLHSFGQNFLWDYDLDRDFHLFLELCPNTSLLGHNLLKYCDALKVYRQFDSVRDVDPEALKALESAEELHEILNNLRTIMENQVLSYKKQNTITVELLIKAHDCFVHECSMEGIAFVLHRCKAITSILASAKSWRLIVKLLMGVGRYRDMYYCFEVLLKNDQFESLLGQFDEERCNGFKDAIIAYLREYHPNDKDNYHLVALHFQMYHELAHYSESEARRIIDTELRIYEKNMDDEVSVASLNLVKQSTDQLDDAGKNGSGGGGIGTSAANVSHSNSMITINGNLSSAIASGVNFLTCAKHLAESLNTAMDCYAHAAENYLLDNKLGLAQRAASNAELVAMQIHLIRNALENDKTNCMCVLNIRNENVFRHLVNNELTIPQSLILSRAYPYEITWTESIFNQYVLQGKGDYIIEYCVRMELTDDMIEHLVKNFIQTQQSSTTMMEKAISTIIEMVQSVTLRYRLASLLSDKRTIATMINGDCLYYLKDTNYGRNESL